MSRIYPGAQVGEIYGRLTVIGESSKRSNNRQKIWICRCVCGNEMEVTGGRLRSGNTKSCGCLHKEVVRSLFRKHGESNGSGNISPEYESWCHMIGRCYNPKNKDFHHYGGRGISICSKWRDSFPSFLSDIGRRPAPGYSLDRIDVNLGYSPVNCRWVKQKQQCRNKRTNRRITIDGVTKILCEWAEESGVSWQAIRYRLEAGWDPRTAVFTPSRRR